MVGKPLQFSSDIRLAEAGPAPAASDLSARTVVPVPATLQIHPIADRDELQAFISRAVAEVHLAVGGDPRPRAYRIAKRTLDLIVAGLGLVLLSPLLLLLAALIRLDSPGPAFYVQPRVGYQGRIFPMFKFRSMVDTDDPIPTDGSHKDSGELRATRIGKTLRRASLDELPQLINVLRGEMSLVGPRPEIASIVVARYELWQYQRFLVPQGMTGWWQMTGRGTKLLCKNTEDDLFYIEHASLSFDLRILAQTIRAVVTREGAY